MKQITARIDVIGTAAALGQIADVATAYFTAAIAVHTFNSLVLHHRLPLWFCSVAVAFGWVAAIVIAIAPTKMQLKSGPFYSTDGLSCVISREYPMLVTVLHLIPIFLSAFVSVLFYSLVFLILRGTLTIRGGLKLNLDIEARRSTMHGALEYPKFIAAIARSMLWYPVVYVIFMFPHVIICLLQASGASVSISLEALGLTCTAMLGLANVSVFYNTVRIMGPAFGDSSTSSVKSEKSFSSPHKAESPVDVAPPVAAFIAPKAFPPPRSITPRPSMETLRGRDQRVTDVRSPLAANQ
ncbi:hypothetical protein EW026_g5582 [Hermanssonia centrifuga]|uniref:G-protein coupled receptors family 1 profile domain-containing protein n=1 Tax=Hermanssonia centrifuga TaxID=98765 RepID=A0A4S4KDQ2_9APHY|nr:hypothetical protein EW026_g5582 [Hermanssonia centrifuga]